MLISIRSKDIEQENEYLLHVPVNETFSMTDHIRKYSHYSPLECVKRGLEEELGLAEGLYINDNDISFHDFAIVTDEGEVGISCHVNLTKIPIEQIQLYPGQDKYLELSELVQVPYPGLFSFNPIRFFKLLNPENRILEKWFFEKIKNDRLSLSWMSFTPLIYQRMIVRNLNFPPLFEIILSGIATFLLTIWLHSFSHVNNIETWIKNILPILIAVLLSFIFNFRSYRFKYKRIMPFVPQWSGNAKAIQTTGITMPGPTLANPNNGIQLGIISKDDISYDISELQLVEKPYCAVRKEFSGMELPISFSLLQKKDDSILNNHLRFVKINFCKNVDKCILLLKISYKDKKIRNIYISQEIVNISINFAQKAERTYQSYYKFSENFRSIYNDCKIGEMPNAFKENYQICDLFEYKGNYYWSCIDKMYNGKETVYTYNVNEKNCKSKLLYNDIMGCIEKEKNNDGVVECQILGNSLCFEKLINSFLSNIHNRRKISDFDIFALQYILIREKIVLANVDYR